MAEVHLLHEKCCSKWLHCAIFTNYHATHKNVAATCSKIESILFCCTLQQHFFTIFCCTARKIHLWDTVQFFHAHAMQQIALPGHEKIAPWSLTFTRVHKKLLFRNNLLLVLKLKSWRFGLWKNLKTFPPVLENFPKKLSITSKVSSSEIEHLYV